MPILVTCQCGAKIRAPDKLAGRAMFCPQCSQQIAIPAGPRPSGPAGRPVPTRPAPRPAQPAAPVVEIDEDPDAPPPRSRPRAARVEADDEVAADKRRPAARRSGKARAPAKRAALSPRAWAAIGAGVLALLAIAIGVYVVVGGTSADAGPAAPGETSNRPAAGDVKVTANQLLGDYAADEAAADRKYQGNLMDVSGFVARVTKEADNNIAVELKRGKGLESFTVKCLFRFKHQAEAKALEVGQPVMIRGRCDGKQGDSATGKIVLKDCRFVKEVPGLVPEGRAASVSGR